MAKKKTTTTAKAEAPSQTGTAITPVTAADLVTAGIVDFKLTKEDLIDLLVEEAAASAEADVKRIRAALDESVREHTDAQVARKAAWEHAAKRTPVVLAAMKMFSTVTWSNHNWWGASTAAVVAACSNKPGGPAVAHVLLSAEVLADDPGVAAAVARVDRAAEAYSALLEEFHLAEVTQERIKSSPRKIRVALVRQVLGNNDKGRFALDNASHLAAGVLDAARESVRASREANEVRCVHYPTPVVVSSGSDS
jgi:hypothetical protein